MKLSDNTIAILKNFAKINSSIAIKPGSTLATISKLNILGVAKVVETFDQNFAIYDLTAFLGLVSMFNQPELTFHKEYVTMRQGNHQIRFTFCEPSLIDSPKFTSIPIKEPVAEFALKASDVRALSRSIGLLKSPDIQISSEEGDIMVKTLDTQNLSGNEFSIIVGKTDEQFSFVYDKDTITSFMEFDYQITISKNSVIRYASENVTYSTAGKVKK